jgi:hypothetical protein
VALSYALRRIVQEVKDLASRWPRPRGRRLQQVAWRECAPRAVGELRAY